MKAREYLDQIEVIETRIHSIQFDIQRLKDLALSITPAYEGERVQSSGNLHRTASVVDKWVDKEREMTEIIAQLVETQWEIIQTIEHLKRPMESGVLHMLYVQKKSFKEVAAHYDKSVSWAISIHGRALQSLQKVLDARNVQ